MNQFRISICWIADIVNFPHVSLSLFLICTTCREKKCVRRCDSYSGGQYKYVCITTDQPDIKSNPNPNSNPTTKQHAIVSIKLNTVTCPTNPEKNRTSRQCCCIFCSQLSVFSLSLCKCVWLTAKDIYCRLTTRRGWTRMTNASDTIARTGWCPPSTSDFSAIATMWAFYAIDEREQILKIYCGIGV